MHNAPPPPGSRAELVKWLTDMRNILHFIDHRWQRKAVIGQHYLPPVEKKLSWGLGAYVICAGIIFIVMFTFFGTTLAQANLVVILIALVILFVAPFGAMVFYNRVLLPGKNEKTQRENQQRQAHNATVRAEEEQIDAQLTRAGRDIAEHVGDQFPRAYMYDDAVAFCTTMVQNHRASTVTEALNLYENELHQRRVLDMHAAQLAEQRQTRKTIAVGNVVNAAMHGAAIGTMRSEGRATRAAMQRPQTVYIKRK